MKKIFLILLIIINLVFCATTNKDLARKRAKDFKYQYNLGLFHLNEGNFVQAIKHLNTCLNLNPKYYLAYNALGLTYAMQGNLEKAIEYYKKCLEINPDFPEAHNNLGIIYQHMGFLDKAKEEYLKAVSYPRYPHKELPYYNLALLSLTQDKAEQALNYIDLALRENDKYGMGYNLKGTILEKLGDLEGAINNYKKALKIVPEEVNFMFNLAVALFKNKNYDEAENVFEKLLKRPITQQMKSKIEDYLNKIKKIIF
ncbi:tetratricopeptide repeat protein [Candidatus Aminicenantes bacterium AH-873-B07]|jgi:Tfp pilus assembly protein PilF|nr:tetratricopeptide repeat protein [Candidatus Aminicenantes bacterium AH-873-B07]